eukprot:619084-Rhodomonas_salina.1
MGRDTERPHDDHPRMVVVVGTNRTRRLNSEAEQARRHNWEAELRGRTCCLAIMILMLLLTRRSGTAAL